MLKHAEAPLLFIDAVVAKVYQYGPAALALCGILKNINMAPDEFVKLWEKF